MDEFGVILDCSESQFIDFNQGHGKCQENRLGALAGGQLQFSGEKLTTLPVKPLDRLRKAPSGLKLCGADVQCSFRVFLRLECDARVTGHLSYRRRPGGFQLARCASMGLESNYIDWTLWYLNVVDRRLGIAWVQMAVSSNLSATRVEPASQQAVLKAGIEIERHDKQSRFPFVVLAKNYRSRVATALQPFR